jgi:hypothetical protein
MVSPEQERIAKTVLDAAFEVYSYLVPGLLESACQTCMLAACCTCGFLRHFVPKNHDLWAALGVCKVKNRLIGDF